LLRTEQARRGEKDAGQFVSGKLANLPLMHTGIILFYLPEKGYGYLRLLDTREEFHFREKNVMATGLRKGDVVNFRLRKGRQGYYADEVRKVGLA